MTDRTARGWLARLRGLIGRLAGKPAMPDALPDWDTFESYSDLARAARLAHRLEPEAFLEGPFRRFLVLCSDAQVPSRARVRMMEFGRQAWRQYCEQRPASEQARLQEQALALAAGHLLRPEVPDGDYILEVFEGISTHNYRGKENADAD